MLASPFDYKGNVLGRVGSYNAKLDCKTGVDLLGMGARSETDYFFGSSMALPIQGAKLCHQCAANTTGNKGFRPAYYNVNLEACSECQTVDPTDPCVYKNKDWKPSSGCNFGFARNLNNWASPVDGNRFAQYRWG